MTYDPENNTIRCCNKKHGKGLGGRCTRRTNPVKWSSKLRNLEHAVSCSDIPIAWKKTFVAELQSLKSKAVSNKAFAMNATQNNLNNAADARQRISARRGGAAPSSATTTFAAQSTASGILPSPSNGQRGIGAYYGPSPNYSSTPASSSRSHSTTSSTSSGDSSSTAVSSRLRVMCFCSHRFPKRWPTRCD